MLEQEIASAMKFILDNSGGASPYYHLMSQDFIVPAVYFPTPEIRSSGDTFSTYALDYMWHVMFFHKDTESAFEIGLLVLSALRSNRNLIPIIDEKGEPVGGGFRIKDPSLRAVDTGAVRLTLEWYSPRPYFAEESEKAAVFETNFKEK